MTMLHTCIRDDGGTGGRRCEACEAEAEGRYEEELRSKSTNLHHWGVTLQGEVVYLTGLTFYPHGAPKAVNGYIGTTMAGQHWSGSIVVMLTPETVSALRLPAHPNDIKSDTTFDIIPKSEPTVVPEDSRAAPERDDITSDIRPQVLELARVVGQQVIRSGHTRACEIVEFGISHGRCTCGFVEMRLRLAEIEGALAKGQRT